MKTRKLLALMGLPALLLVPFTAAQAERPGLYIGGSWGAYRINESNLDEHDDVIKAFAGVQFNNWFGVEGSWVDFNRTSNPNGSSRFEADGRGLAAVFSVPFSESSSFFAKVGQFWWKADSVLGSTVGERDGHDIFYGAGFKFGFNKYLAWRLEAERYDVTDVRLDTVSVGLQFNF